MSNTLKITQRVFAIQNIAEDSVSIYFIRDTIAIDPEGNIVPQNSYSEIMDSKGNFIPYKEFDLIPATLKIPGIVAYELVKAGFTEPIQETIQKLIDKAMINYD